MPRLDLQSHTQGVREKDLRQGFLLLVSDGEAMKLVEAMVRLMQSGHLGFYVSPRLMRKLKAFAAEKQVGAGEQTSEDVDVVAFFSWLEEVGSMEPPLEWDIESLPNNGGIYRMLMEGGQSEESTSNNPSE